MQMIKAGPRTEDYKMEKLLAFFLQSSQADIFYTTSKLQWRQSTADPPTAKSQITPFFRQSTAEANHDVVEPQCRADPGRGEVESQDCELSSPALAECGDEQAGTLVMPLSSRDVIRTTHSKILATPMMFLANVKMWSSALFTTSEGILIRVNFAVLWSKTQDFPHYISMG